MVELGNYKSYGLSKEQSCKAVNTRVEPNFNNQQEINQGLDQIQPNSDGATPIAYAINKVAYELEAKNLLPSRILLISDGQPNCNDEYQIRLCGIIGTLVNDNPPIDVKVDVISYKDNGDNSEFLKCSQKYPNVFHYWGSADNLSELKSKVTEVLPPSTDSIPASPSTSPIYTPTPTPSPSLPGQPPQPPPNCNLKTGLSLVLLLCAIAMFAILYFKGQIQMAFKFAGIVAALGAVLQALPCGQ